MTQTKRHLVSIATTSCLMLLSISTRAQVSLPQGLTCGLDHTSSVFGFDSGSRNYATCRGHATLRSDNAPGFTIVHDGDFGMPAGQGFTHQELSASAEGIQMVIQEPSEHYWDSILPQGAVCGFHHTLNSQGHTCMGRDPALGECPSGWERKQYFDMSSGNGYWAWCEYQNPLHYFIEPPIAGLACGVGGSTSQGNNIENGFCVRGRVGGDMGAAYGWISTTSFFDAGRPSGDGLGWASSPPAYIRIP